MEAHRQVSEQLMNPQTLTTVAGGGVHQRLLMNSGDLAALERERFSHRFQRQRAVGFGRDDAVEHASVFEINDGHTKVGSHNGARVDDILQQIIEVVAARAGKVRADLPSVTVKRVASGASGVENHPALALVRLRKCDGHVLGLPLCDELLLVGTGIAEFAPRFRELVVQRRIVQTSNLPGVKSGNVLARNSSPDHRVEQ